VITGRAGRPVSARGQLRAGRHRIQRAAGREPGQPRHRGPVPGQVPGDHRLRHRHRLSTPVPGKHQGIPIAVLVFAAVAVAVAGPVPGRAGGQPPLPLRGHRIPVQPVLTQPRQHRTPPARRAAIQRRRLAAVRRARAVLVRLAPGRRLGGHDQPTNLHG